MSVVPPAAAACRMCGSASVHPWLEKHGVPIFRCAACDGGFVPDAAVPADLEALYRREYFEGACATGYPTYQADLPFMERTFARRLAWIAARARRGRLLDVGAAYGAFLRVARADGWAAMGVEIAPDCAAAAARYARAPVIAGDFLRADLPGGFDVITMFDVIEHLRDPGASLDRALALLAPDGIVVIETGDRASPWARALGRRWYFLDPPQHLSYFSARGLDALLGARGLAIRGRARPGRWVSLANVAFKLAHHGGGPLRALEGVRPPGAVWVNFGDVMLVAAAREAART
jgi:SAM-dependent methyltransferase